MPVIETVPLLVEVANLLCSGASTPIGGDINSWKAFREAHAALTRKLEQDRKAWELLARLVTEDHKLTPEQVRWCLEFIYSHLVNKYQGVLAELLAARELSAWLSEQVACEELGPEISFVGGEDILERRYGKSHGPWLRGADGLLLASLDRPDRLCIAGVVEIKSYPVPLARISRQLEKHVLRLHQGIRIGDEHYPAERLTAAWWRKRDGWQLGSRPADWRRVLRILVSPRRRADRARVPEKLPPSNHHVTLPVSKIGLAATAYHLTVHLLEKLGAEVYRDGSPWPEMSPEEAAVNSVKEALYHILLEHREGSPHATRVATRLYNVYGFGYATSEGHREMLWAQEDGEPTSGSHVPIFPLQPLGVRDSKDLVERAWHYYRKGELEAAEEWAQAALELAPEDAARRHVPWLIGMIHFYRCDFSGACRLLPEPGRGPEGDGGWWAKDLLTLARACTRAGDLSRSEECIAALSREGLRWSYLAVAVPVARGWIAFRRGMREQAAAWLDEACAQIERLRAEQREREDGGLGDPPYHDPDALQHSVLDAATLIVCLGRCEEGLQMIEQVRGVFTPIVEMVSADPALESLRAGAATHGRLAQWLERERQGRPV